MTILLLIQCFTIFVLSFGPFLSRYANVRYVLCKYQLLLNYYLLLLPHFNI